MEGIVLLCHGESLWNKENCFTGWTGANLSEKGVEEACKAGNVSRETGFSFEAAYTSYLKRVVETLNCVLNRLDEGQIPVEKTWWLNEKHCNMFQGPNESKATIQYDEKQVHIWRRSYDMAPAPVSKDDPRSPGMGTHYTDISDGEPPCAESLKDVIGCVMPYWKCIIFPALMYKDDLLVVAHGSGLRGIIKYLEGISDTNISGLNLPTAISYIFEFDDGLVLVKDYYLGDLEEIREQARAVVERNMIRR